MPKKVIENAEETRRHYDKLILSTIKKVETSVGRVHQRLDILQKDVNEFRTALPTYCAEKHKEFSDFMEKEQKKEVLEEGIAKGKDEVKVETDNKLQKRLTQITIWGGIAGGIVSLILIFQFVNSLLNRQMSFRDWQRMQRQYEATNSNLPHP